jgi:hypothetical protein
MQLCWFQPGHMKIRLGDHGPQTVVPDQSVSKSIVHERQGLSSCVKCRVFGRARSEGLQASRSVASGSQSSEQPKPSSLPRRLSPRLLTSAPMLLRYTNALASL